MAKNFDQLRDDLVARIGEQRLEDVRRETEEADARYRRTLRALREALRRTQKDLAARLDISQAVVSRIENRTDLHLSTLNRYVNALGGRVELQAVFEHKDESITIPLMIGSDIGPVADPVAREDAAEHLQRLKDTLAEERFSDTLIDGDVELPADSNTDGAQQKSVASRAVVIRYRRTAPLDAEDLGDQDLTKGAASVNAYAPLVFGLGWYARCTDAAPIENPIDILVSLNAIGSEAERVSETIAAHAGEVPGIEEKHAADAFMAYLRKLRHTAFTTVRRGAGQPDATALAVMGLCQFHQRPPDVNPLASLRPAETTSSKDRDPDEQSRALLMVPVFSFDAVLQEGERWTSEHGENSDARDLLEHLRRQLAEDRSDR